MNIVLSRRNILFTIIVIAGFFLLTRVPVRGLLRHNFGETTAELGYYAFLSILVIAAGFFVAGKTGIFLQGGFKGGRKSNYWMLLLPLLFPGLMFIGNIRSCGTEYFTGSGLLITGVVILRALMEEVLCRGLIQGFVEKHSPGAPRWKIIFFSAAVFALLHFVALASNYHPAGVVNQVIFSFLAGLLLGAILLRTRNIWLLGLVHGLINLASKSCNSAPVTEETVTISDYIASAAIFTLVMLPMLLITWLLLRSAPRPVGIQPESATR